MTATSISTSLNRVNRSTADAEFTKAAALQPAARGQFLRACQGEILVMLGHYGWIMACDDIDHADVGMTAGRVYVHKRDVLDGESLAQGDIVSFYLYADDQGLGAECCRLERSASACLNVHADEFVPAQAVAPPSLRLDADEFVPGQLSAGSPPSLNVCASEFVPTSAATFSSSLSMKAAEFVPSQFSLDAQEFVPPTTWSNIVVANPNVMMFNPAFLDDFSDDSDDESMDDFSGNDADKENNDSDKESSCDERLASFTQDMDFETISDLDVEVVHAPLKSVPALSADDSTSAGTSSESEDEPVVHCAVRAPPGLSLPAGWRAPPGLSLPVLVA